VDGGSPRGGCALTRQRAAERASGVEQSALKTYFRAR
jgi:hypothetical protein